MYATFLGQWGWQVIRIDHGVAQIVAGAVDQAHADRIRDLFDRHGLVDVPLEAVEHQP